MSSTIWEKTAGALSSLAMPFAASKLRVSTGQEYPDTFLTYFLVSAPPIQHADNEEKIREYTMQVNVFSRNGLINLPDVDGAMTAAGFMKGAVREIPLDAETGHYGLGTEFSFTESEE